ncbi:MAG: TetR family transcriptional regulator [Hyphomonadaceae bacterium]|nr:TetR family transcriptional regulator [Hyphomonadaceae bacterium]MAV51035.1 TetR family transcriptional regulator [Hyphomonadaceae bacterium]OUX93159.1 MAG: hypothetical protein CBB77_10670 [Hyphomonas sp. TMED17]
MTIPVAAYQNTPWPEPDNVSSDGRRQRSSRSRRQIIEAVFDLLKAGDLSPSAAAVAKQAEVGLRTVFRHFEDMDSIYNEMAEQAFEAIKPKIEVPLEAQTWREQLMEILDKRADIFETVFPMQICMHIRRFKSDFLQAQHERDLALFEQSLRAVLPDIILNDPPLLAALDVALGFPTWQRLRQDQGLTVDQAKDAIAVILKALIKDIQDD